MTVELETFDIKSKAYCDVINITSQVQNAIEKSGLKNGIVNVHVAGSTGAISTVEYEPGLVQNDIGEFLEKIIPYKNDYAHHKTWHDYNGAGHLRSFPDRDSQRSSHKDTDFPSQFSVYYSSPQPLTLPLL